jgi:RNA polymerase sigma-70 factor (ECF subfamily)
MNNDLLDNLFRQHNKELLNYAFHRAGDVAEDMVQESFVRLMQHPDLTTIENHRAYLYKVTSNSLVDHNRKQRVIAKYHEDCDDLDTLPSALLGPEITLHHQQRLLRYLQALDELPVIDRTVFLLHRFDGMTYPQIAKLLKLSKSTVERHFASALEHCFVASLQDTALPSKKS